MKELNNECVGQSMKSLTQEQLNTMYGAGSDTTAAPQSTIVYSAVA